MANSKKSDSKEIQSVLRFLNYVVNSIEFYTNDTFNEDEPVGIDFNIERAIDYSDDNTIYVTLKVRIFDHAAEKNYPFSMNLSLTGIFEVGEVTAEEKSQLAEGNAVAILFPYLRSIVSTYSANANVAPLILPPINVLKLIEDQASK
jgi:preprotein translocase subunit SecB